VLKLVDNPQTARLMTRKAIARLIYLAMATHIKDQEKHLVKLTESRLLHTKIGDAKNLYEELALAAILKLLDEIELPRSQAHYDEAVTFIKNNWLEAANKVAMILFEIVTAYQKIAKYLQGSITPAWMIALADVKNQTSHLLHAHFLVETPFSWLQYFPRYLQAILIRLDKLSGQLNKDKQYTQELAEYWQRYLARTKNTPLNDELLLYRFMMEEYRVSLFAQQLGTKVPVSAKRLNEQWQKAIL
jgi:ATP-dependent helicase HrpA